MDQITLREFLYSNETKLDIKSALEISIKIITAYFKNILSKDQLDIDSLIFCRITHDFKSHKNTFHVSRKNKETEIYKFRAVLLEIFARISTLNQQEDKNLILEIINRIQYNRYICIYGVLADLKECLKQLKTHGSISSFELGLKDIPSNLIFPKHTYGRDEEIYFLEAALDRVKIGSSELIIVTGESGVGKTFLITNFFNSILDSSQHFLYGKFDQKRHNDLGAPFNAIVDAFRQLINTVITLKAEQQQQLIDKINKKLHPNIQILINLIPELQILLGKQPHLQDVGLREIENRFKFTFKQFIFAVAETLSPLIIFLDDLQWTDEASLDFIKDILIDNTSKNLLIVGAIRTTDVFEDKLNRLRIIFENASWLSLKNFSKDVTHEMIKDILNETKENTSTLAQVIHKKTFGNPFFVNQILFTLEEENKIKFNIESGVWEWDIHEVKQMPISNNVAELLIERTNMLPLETIELLKIAACLGNSFDSHTLTLATNIKPLMVQYHLWAAIKRGLITSLTETDKQLDEDKKIIYKFQHDNIQRAIKHKISAKNLVKINNSIGNKLLNTLTTKELNERIFEIVDYINFGNGHNGCNIYFAQFNLKASKKALESIAYKESLLYINYALSYISGCTWHDNYELFLNCYLLKAECEHLVGNYQNSNDIFNLILFNCKSKFDKAQVYNKKLLLGAYIGNDSSCLLDGLYGLSTIGMKLVESPGKMLLLLAFIKVKFSLKNKNPHELINLPFINDTLKLLQIEILGNLLAPAYFHDKTLFVYLILKMINVSIKYGNSEFSYFCYVTYGLILSGKFGKYNDGYEFGKLALDIVNSQRNIRYKGRTYMVFIAFIKHWKDPVETCLKPLDKAFNYCIKEGDINYAGYIADIKLFIKVSKGDNLDNIYKLAEKHMDFARQTKHQAVIHCIYLAKKFILNLKGENKDLFSFSDENFNEQDECKKMLESKNTVLYHWYLILKMILFYLFGKYEEALEIAEISHKVTEYSMGLFHLTDHYFYYALILCKILSKYPQKDRYKKLKLLKQLKKQLKNFSNSCPDNFFHKDLLISAEYHRLEQKYDQAINYYTQAMNLAVKHSFTSCAGIICESFANFYLEKNNKFQYEEYKQKAIQHFSAWGAVKKVEQLTAI